MIQLIRLLRDAGDCGCEPTSSVIPPTSPVQAIETCSDPQYPAEADPECQIKVKPKCIPMGITNATHGITPDMNLAQVMAIVLTKLPA